ncbi:MAG: creatininase family protein [Planctomycetota bacterium]|nr:creatininase family protein [Planctomycetota bacterium]
MELAELNWPAVDRLDRKTPIVFPIAAVEQHGHHMPVLTDTLLLSEIMRRVKGLPVASQVLFAPVQWFGNSDHHIDLPGTLSASPRAYLNMLHDMAENFLRHRFRRIVFVNGHGGNTIPSQQAMFELRQKHRAESDLLLTAVTYWESCDPHATVKGLDQSEMGHACEWETSMMLELRPELVSPDYRSVAEVPFGRGGKPGYRGWTTPDRSRAGHIGNPAVASKEKGDALFSAFAVGVADYLERAVNWNGDTWNF